MKILNDLAPKKACIVMPTYNEKGNISKMLDELMRVFSDVRDFEMLLLVVDGYSPDGTGEIVEEFGKGHSSVHLIRARKEGLGKAYVRGFSYAINELGADYILEMDADFSHDPRDLHRFLGSVKEGSNFVIGSRYIEGGSIPDDWGWMRKMNSSIANFLARFIAGLNPIRDCTSGFRCISSKLIKKIDLGRMDGAGYAFQMNLLFESLYNNVNVKEIPINFIDREIGKSKIRIKDRTEFVINAFKLRIRKSQKQFLYLASLIVLLSALSVVALIGTENLSLFDLLINFYLLISVVMLAQGAVNLYMTLYIWERPEMVERNKLPEKFIGPKRSFSILLPARNEETVIRDTIEGLLDMDYPKTLMEIIVICEKEDTGTIAEVKKSMSKIKDGNIKLVIFGDKPVNKPHALNKGLEVAKNDVLTIYDAEDEVNPQILLAINTVMANNKEVGVVQSGVQLMNYGSRWFSVHNVLEYYFWFKSRLHFHADIGMIPLGGNSVFFEKQLLEDIGGWDEDCLTEDADIGIRLSTQGVKTMVVYDESYTTQEETPNDLGSFVRQRTRWVQGFLQVFLKFDWLYYQTLIQKAIAAYVLLIAFLQALTIVMLPVSVFIMMKFDLGVVASIILILPIYLLFIQLAVNLMGIYEFIKSYRVRFEYRAFINLLVTFFPYQCLLGVSALRGLMRQLVGKNNWEKTRHSGIHRNLSYEENLNLGKTYESTNTN